MSTYLYLQCADHDPPLRSDGEVGQHTYDLAAVRGFIRQREHLATVFMESECWTGGNTAELEWRHNAAKFFADHPHCTLGIISEYGDAYPLESPEERIGKVFVDFAGSRWWLDGGKYLTCAPLNEDGSVDMANAGEPVNGSSELWRSHLWRLLKQTEKEQPTW